MYVSLRPFRVRHATEVAKELALLLVTNNEEATVCTNFSRLAYVSTYKKSRPQKLRSFYRRVEKFLARETGKSYAVTLHHTRRGTEVKATRKMPEMNVPLYFPVT